MPRFHTTPQIWTYETCGWLDRFRKPGSPHSMYRISILCYLLLTLCVNMCQGMCCKAANCRWVVKHIYNSSIFSNLHMSYARRSSHTYLHYRHYNGILNVICLTTPLHHKSCIPPVSCGCFRLFDAYPSFECTYELESIIATRIFW